MSEERSPNKGNSKGSSKRGSGRGRAGYKRMIGRSGRPHTAKGKRGRRGPSKGSSNGKPATAQAPQQTAAKGSANAATKAPLVFEPTWSPSPEAEFEPAELSLDSRYGSWVGRVGAPPPLHRHQHGPVSGPALKWVLHWTPPATGRPEQLSVQVFKAQYGQGGALVAGNLLDIPNKDSWEWRTGWLDALPSGFRSDSERLRLLVETAQMGRENGTMAWTLRPSPLADHLLADLLGTGRLYWEDAEVPLSLGLPLGLRYQWVMDGAGEQKLHLLPPKHREPLSMFELSRRWYVARQSWTMGELSSPLPRSAETALLDMPPVPPAQATALADDLQTRLARLGHSALDFPLPTRIPLRREKLEHTPVITLTQTELELVRGRGSSRKSRVVPVGVARLTHEYGGQELPSTPANLPSVYTGEEVLVRSPDPAAEAEADKALLAAGLTKASRYGERGEQVNHPDLTRLYLTRDEAAWEQFFLDDLPKLEDAGFAVRVGEAFPHRFTRAEQWYGETRLRGGWFEVDFGIEVGGERVSLIPVLTALMAERPELFTAQALADLPSDAGITATLPDGRRVRLAATRIRALLSALTELRGLPEQSGPLRLPRLAAERLQAAQSELETALNATWKGARSAGKVAKELREAGGVPEVEPPKGLQADLRPYQLQGLAWLQFLRGAGLGGVLADDMGLGKTLQTLAHLLLEKEAGRLRNPALVVAPTSVLSNWRNEAERFTPELKALVLRGPGREAYFDQLGEYDLVLTTYPLLPRDIEALEKERFYYVILDEAQNIKNPRSAAALAARSLSADHRLALTGTPLENHLGELWSLFEFLMPGYLGTAKAFKESYRHPIEKEGDADRQAALTARVRPLILRREKRDVVSELPPKTEMIVPLPLGEQQAELYESVRVSMLGKVRRELKARGLGASAITVLDSLLKLRQAATDPRLVKLKAAEGITESAKANWLRGVLPEMVEEGRRILIFSQFASLLTLLEGTLQDLGLSYAKLTGRTRQRDQQIDKFQAGEADVFLISLKAGGTGLNLTAADTVIHMDPWWNPAAEAQATDRAYRIGQDKPVFVYKLIAAGSVEERVLDMQRRKSALAKGVLEGGLDSAASLTEHDLDALLAPLEGEE